MFADEILHGLYFHLFSDVGKTSIQDVLMLVKQAFPEACSSSNKSYEWSEYLFENMSGLMILDLWDQIGFPSEGSPHRVPLIGPPHPILPSEPSLHDLELAAISVELMFYSISTAASKFLTITDVARGVGVGSTPPYSADYRE